MASKAKTKVERAHAKLKAKAKPKAKAKGAKAFVPRMTDAEVASWLKAQHQDVLCGPIVKLRRLFHDQGHKRAFANFLGFLAAERKRRGIAKAK